MLLQKLEDDNVLVYYGVSLSKTTLFNLFYTCPWWVSTHSPLGSSHKGCFLPALSKSVCLVPSLSVCSHGFLISYQFFLAPAIFTSGPDLYRNINPTNYFLFFFCFVLVRDSPLYSYGTSISHCLCFSGKKVVLFWVFLFVFYIESNKSWRWKACLVYRRDCLYPRVATCRGGPALIL